MLLKNSNYIALKVFSCRKSGKANFAPIYENFRHLCGTEAVENHVAVDAAV